MNPLFISALISAAVSFGAAWQIQGWRMDGLKLEYANEQLAREQSSREQLSQAQAKINAAQDAARLATDRVRTDVAGAVRSTNGLRDTLASSVRAAHVDLVACTGQVAALSELLGTVVDAGGRMAKEADDWSIQAVTLQSANPNAGKGAATGQNSPTAGQTN